MFLTKYLQRVLILSSVGDEAAGPCSFSDVTVIKYSVALSNPKKYTTFNSMVNIYLCKKHKIQLKNQP